MQVQVLPWQCIDTVINMLSRVAVSNFGTCTCDANRLSSNVSGSSNNATHANHFNHVEITNSFSAG